MPASILYEQDVKESVLDTQLIYALARINKMSELEELISGPNVAKIDQIGTYVCTCCAARSSLLYLALCLGHV